MANPASVNCGNIGGTTEIKTNADGSQYGMCTFSNGTTCEEWALFRGEGCQAGAEVNQTGNGPATGQTGMANPASVSCVKNGGTLEIKDSAARPVRHVHVYKRHLLRGVGVVPGRRLQSRKRDRIREINFFYRKFCCGGSTDIFQQILWNLHAPVGIRIPDNRMLESCGVRESVAYLPSLEKQMERSLS